MTVEIPLSDGSLKAIVDEDDVDLVREYTWYVQKDKWNTYAIGRSHGPALTLMHRLILGFPSSETDHINGNGLDNRRSNLRVVTTSQNQANRRPDKNAVSPYKGVFKDRNRWSAAGCHNRVRKYLGSYATQEEAARAYDAWAKEMHGDYARLNFPEGV